MFSPPLPLRLAAADGLALAACRQAGPGRPVLLAHGFGQTQGSWRSTQARLAASGFPSLAWDMRGHGGSDRNPSGRTYCAEQFVADVLVAARAAGDRPVLVGASMGGLTGLMAQAQARPFSALVLVDVTPQWEPAGVARILEFMTAFPDGFASHADAADAIAAYLPHRGRKSPTQLDAVLRADADGRLRWHWDPRLIEEFVRHSEHLQDDIAAATRTLDVPVLLLSGGRSDIVSTRTIEHFRTLVPHARHVHLPQATHMLAGDDNDAFADALLAFLGAQSAEAGAAAFADSLDIPLVHPLSAVTGAHR